MHSGLQKHMLDMFVKVANKFEVLCIRKNTIYLGLVFWV